jgi:hypothetical protein
VGKGRPGGPPTGYRQEAIKSLRVNGFQGDEPEAEAALKSLIAAKKFKVYTFQLAVSAERNTNYMRSET